MKKKLVAGAITVAVILAAFGYYIYAAAPFSEYTKITVTEGQGKIVTIGEYEYAFTYDHNAKLFAVATSISIIASTYKTTVGATYNVFGLEIKVSEVHDSYCILLAKSTVP